MKTLSLGCLLLATPLLMGQTDDQEPAQAESGESALMLDFEAGKDAPKWSAVNDGVMGGKSQGGAEMGGGTMMFAGTLSLENNGGFSSVRTNDGPWDLNGTEGIRLRVKGDGRTYNLRLSTDAKYRGDRIAYQALFETEAGEWIEVSVPFAKMTPSHHGEELEGPEFDLSTVTEVGILLANKQAGDFALEVDWMKSYEEESEE